MPRFLRSHQLAGMLLVAVSGGCGGVEGAPPAAARPEAVFDACVLLQRGDLDPDGEMGLLKIRTAIDPTEGTRFAKCGWGVPRTDIFASIEVRRMDSPERARAAQSDSLPVLRRLARATVVDVSGVGDTAAWAGGRLDQLHFVSRAFRLVLTLQVGPESTRAERAREIALHVLERLRILDLAGPAAPPRSP